MAESHILLLPKADYFTWVKASKNYIMKFGVNTTPDPPRAGTKQNITVAVSPNGYAEGDIVAWLTSRFAQAKIDAITVNTPQEFQAQLQQRVDTDQRYGAPPPPPAVVALPQPIYLFWPSDYPTITQGFAENPQIYGQWGLPGHEGLDIRAPMNSNIYCCWDGDVFKVENNPNVHPYGLHVRVQHADGYQTVYAHLAEIHVKEGDHLMAKQFIGKADSTGNSTGSHLHLTFKKAGATARGETQFQGDVIDPTPFMVYPDKEAEIMALLGR